ncbi:MAG: hypothetical protein RMI89_01510 [Gloeomargarita sp. SKYBB_i_bin120]|nr:hypothetical protein [Gloeomargarita sp. SKYG98]MCS7291640.1 hypothetical protein [Gloeomargarita sp. SKYB120]MDW8177199.1 hypothetical protein [Gloeomargarita sp. SKYBB_i_bin120]
MRFWLMLGCAWLLAFPAGAQPRSTTPITDQFKIPPFRDYTGDGVQNLDDIPQHQKNYNDLLRQWASRMSGSR